VNLNPAHGKVHLIQHYVIKFVSDLWYVYGFFLCIDSPFLVGEVRVMVFNATYNNISVI
jgi:hypothetical protein